MVAPLHAPLCPAGHLPHGWGDWLAWMVSLIHPDVAPTWPRVISPHVGEMSGRTEGGAQGREPSSRVPTPHHHHARGTASGHCQRTGKTGGHSDASLSFIFATLRPPVRPLSRCWSVTPAPLVGPGCTFFRWSLPGKRCPRGFSAAFASSVTRCYRPPTCRGPSHAPGTEPEGEAAAALPACPVRIRVPVRAIAGV